MTVLSSVPAGEEFERQLAAVDPNTLRLMVKSFAEALMSAEADEGEQCEDRETESGHALAVQRADQGPAEEDPDGQTEDGAEQGDDDRLPADHRAQLTPGHTECAQ